MSIAGSATARAIMKALIERREEISNNQPEDDNKYAHWRGQLDGLRQAIDIAGQWKDD